MKSLSFLNASSSISDPLGLQLLAEIRHHRVVDDEVRLDDPAAGRLLRDARVAFGRELLRVVLERLRAYSMRPKRPGLNPSIGPATPLVGLDAAAAVDRPARVGALQIARVVRLVDVLILQRDS